MSKNKIQTKQWIYLLIAIVSVIAIIIYFKSSGILGYMSSLEDFKVYIEGFGNSAYIIFFLLQLASIIIAPIPSNVSAVAGAMVFGMWESFIITTLAIVSGSAIVFFLSRICGKAFVERFVSTKILSKYEEIISSKKGEMIIFLMLLLPFFPDDIINFLVGLGSMSFKRYFILLILTRPWEILIACGLGSASISIPLWGWGAILLVSIIIVVNSSKIERKLTQLIKAI
ncbi:VTT domain-containing protein [Clostridium sp.]|uniref:TVP38/TMEM64 family protein n=1 Tax=Clostridium sp. TaxID=1506 RepID=UPI001EB11BFB|nr:VTT domain-containing protein [Clostridium sp.]MBS5884642.1 TVP38/TMEM64 family protein [Clostridium sp.]MDU7242482.1 VTT domain-containing protein [Clostridium sp.]